MKKKFYVPFMAILISLLYIATVNALPPERRRDQFRNTPGSLILPFPYSIPGIGKGLFLVGYAGNAFETPTDLFGIAFTGDAQGYIAAVDEFFIVPDYLYLVANRGTAAKFGQNVYSSRGMDSEKEDYNIYVGESFRFTNFELVLTLFDRQLEVTLGRSFNDGRFIEIRDYEGELIQALDDPIEIEASQTYFEAKIDLTDDYDDPRDGFRFDLYYEQHPTQSSDDPKYDTISAAVTWFVPILEENTWLFHYFRSEAIVLEKGNVDLESLKQKNGFSSCNGLTACQSAVLANAQNQLNANKNGTARGLGGSDRLRSYPLNRYQSAHTEMYGTEFRWNFNTQEAEINLFFLRDIIDSLQAAIFFEQGSVAEERGDLRSIIRSSYGGGLRFVGQSGSVYRLDISTGNEGAEVIAFFEYPWSGFFH